MSPAATGEQRSPSLVPLIVLTGFLGAGKTTVLNRVLGAQHHRRVAVLVNELGRIDIDAGLIRRRAGDVLELTGGCVCHQVGVQRELWSALDDVVKRSRPDVVILETTGIAEPDAIWEGLAELAREASPAGAEDRIVIGQGVTVTVVDAEAGERQLERHEEARAQVRGADRILLSKLDRASAAPLASLHRRLHELNAQAERAAFPAGATGTAALISWLLDGKAPPGRRFARGRVAGATTTGGHEHGHAHAHAPPHGHGRQLVAATFVDDAPLIADALLLVCRSLGDRLVRAKGFVQVAGDARRGFLERAGEELRLELREPWGDEPPLTRLVLIGEELDEAALQRQLWACRAPA